nr:protein MROH8-like [Chrysemys picta bellii]
MGHHVAQLALFVGDPDEDISRQAREGVYRLYQLLLRQRDLNIHEVEDLWCWDWHQDSRLLGYKNTARVGEVFAKFFSEGQRRFFLQTAVLAMHDPLLRVSQAGLLLTYSLLGQTEQLMGSKVSSCIRLRRLGRGPGLIPILWPFASLAARRLVGNESEIRFFF